MVEIRKRQNRILLKSHFFLGEMHLHVRFTSRKSYSFTGKSIPKFGESWEIFNELSILITKRRK